MSQSDKEVGEATKRFRSSWWTPQLPKERRADDAALAQIALYRSFL